MLTDLQQRFGSAVKARRKHLGISQEELAGRAGLHRTYVADVERGARNLSLASIGKLAEGLEWSMPMLFSHAVGEAQAVRDQLQLEIVLVEDDARDIELAQKAFASVNLANRVQVIRDGAEALEYVFGTGRHSERQGRPLPHLMLLSVKLPKVSGADVLRKLRSTPQTRSMPVVLLASSHRQQELAESLQIGAENYLVKPVEFSRFAEIAAKLKFSWALVRSMGI